MCPFQSAAICCVRVDLTVPYRVLLAERSVWTPDPAAAICCVHADLPCWVLLAVRSACSPAAAEICFYVVAPME